MARSLTLAAYLGLTKFADGWARRKLTRRTAEGKEDSDRINERFGQPSISRPAGKLVWFHAASVGESLSLLELMQQITAAYPGCTILVTTGTRSSAQILETRMPDNVIHQYVPVDTKASVMGFLNHWKPDIAIWTESEFWPRLMVQTKSKGIPMLLINGRISEETAKKWRKFKGMSRSMLNRFDLMLVQTPEMAESFMSIGAEPDRVIATGSLKEGAVPLPHDESLRREITKQLGSRPVWFAGSTHDGEEEVIASAHRMARAKHPELLLILAPRHVERSEEITALLETADFKVSTRSKGEKIVGQTDIFLADTLGEMGVWYRIAPVSFVGGSLVPVGGHNPFEPAALGSAILYGPHIFNFADIYQRLYDGEAAQCVRTDGELADAVIRCVNPDEAAKYATAAWEVSSDGAGVTDTVMEHLEPFLKKALG